MSSDKALGNALRLEPFARCPLCGVESTGRRLYCVHGTAVCECPSCSFRYLNPSLSQDSMTALYDSSEELARLRHFNEGYYEYGDLDSPSRTLADYRRALAWLAAILPPGRRRLFEVGFGSGLFLALARSQGWQVAGTELSADNVALARRKFSLDLACGDLSSEPEEPAAFDAVAAWDVLEHQRQPNEFVARLATRLASGGALLLAVPNDRSLLRFLASFLYSLSGGRWRLGIERAYVPEHIGYYTLLTLRRLLEQNGLRLARCRYTSTDLARYKLKGWERAAASTILTAGRLLAIQNRLMVLAVKP